MIKLLSKSILVLGVGLFIISATGLSAKRDGLDCIMLYQNEKLVSKWYEFGDTKTVTIFSENTSDTLTLFCFTDVGWMDSNSLSLTYSSGINQLLKFSRINSDELSGRINYQLALSDINNSSRNISIWRHTSKGASQIFDIKFSSK